jgi:lysophospholipase
MSKELSNHFNRLASPPAGWRDGHFKNKDGQNIRFGYAPVNGSSKKGTVLLTHGYGESTNMYFETIKEYQSRGFEVWAMDWAGMGKSEKDHKNAVKKPNAEHFSRHVDDLHEFISNVVKKDNSKPFIMSTHSFGGHVGLLYLQEHQETFDAAVMSAPMFDITRAGLPVSFRKPLKCLFNFLSKIGLKDTPLPSAYEILRKEEPENQEEKIYDGIAGLRAEWKKITQLWHPDTEMARPTFGWVASAYETIEESLKEKALKSIKTPILIGSAECEDLVDNKAHNYAASVMGDKATLIKMKNAGHNLFHNTDEVHDKWWSHISDFIKEYTSINPSKKASTNISKAANDDKNPPIRKAS